MKTYNKRLYRSEDNKVVLGIMGGFGEYFDIDPTILRAFYIICSIFTAIFPGIIAYVLMSLIVPKNPKAIKVEAKEVEKKEEDIREDKKEEAQKPE